MLREEYYKKYCSGNILSYSQRTIDLMEEVGSMLTNDVDDGTHIGIAVGAAEYEIDCELEVMREDIPDYKFLTEALEALKEISMDEIEDEVRKALDKKGDMIYATRNDGTSEFDDIVSKKERKGE